MAQVFLLFFVTIVFVTYVAAFKEEFSQEHIEKVKPAICVLVAITVVLAILKLLGGVL